MPNHLTPEELSKDGRHGARRTSSPLCVEEGVPIYQGKIDKTPLPGAAGGDGAGAAAAGELPSCPAYTGCERLRCIRPLLRGCESSRTTLKGGLGYVHANAKLGLAGRLALVRAIEDGLTLKAAAAAFSVSPATAHRWWHRWIEASDEARRTMSCLLDRSSRPQRSPRQLAPQLEQAICACRRKTGWGPRLVAGATGFAHSTVWKVLRRAGLSRPTRRAKQPANRYEWPCPGDLLHMDVSRYARFQRPGHRVTGDRSQRSRKWMRPETRVGYDYAHAIVDDHSRLAYVELHLDEQAQTVTGFVERALAPLPSGGSWPDA